jgi:hypothetical protein
LIIKYLPLYSFVQRVALEVLQLLLQICDILLPTASVCDYVKLVGESCNYSIIDNTARFSVEKGRKSGAVLRDRREGGWSYRLEESLGAGS